MRSIRRIACCALVACGAESDRPSPERIADPPAPEGPPQAAAAPDFPEGTRSLELTRTIPVRLEPRDDGKRIGTIAIDTRVLWSRTASGPGCPKAWVEILPRGWVCGEHLTPSTKAPHGREVPYLERGEIVPGIYGKVTGQAATTFTLVKPDARKKRERTGPVTSPREVEAAEPRMVEDKPIIGSLTVRQYEELTVGGKAYWRVSAKGNEYVQRSAVSVHRPSDYRGTRLGDDTGWALPIAFVWPRYGGQLAWTHHKPNAIVNRQLPARTPLAILEVADKDGEPSAYRIGDAEWIAAADVRVFAPVAPPPLLERSERWIDVDLDSQILVAFEGEVPVYATMVSSGTKETPTLTGMYRMWLKESESDMKNLKREDPYSVATVPWTQFFFSDDDLALHTAYWHDGFGKPKSHGCINVAPRDARWLYYWSDPQVPPGWTMTTGVVELPGSVIRVRSAADPEPEWRGYAKKVAEARRMNAPR